MTGAGAGADPVLARRAKAARLARAGSRLGYGLLAMAVVAFFVGLGAGYRVWGPVVVAGLAGSAFTLAPAIVVGYAVKAADREDRARGDGDDRRGGGGAPGPGVEPSPR